MKNHVKQAALMLSALAFIYAPAANCQKEITTFSKELLSKYEGKTVTLKGKYTDRTKLAHAILSPFSEVVYFEPARASNRTSKTDKLPAQQAKMFSGLKDGDHITAAGKLYKFTAPKPLRVDVTSVPDHFYLDENSVKVKPTK